MDNDVYRHGALAGALFVRKAIALTLFFVIVFPGLAVVGLAALRLALLACAKNTKAVRPPGSLTASARLADSALPCTCSLALGHTPLCGLGRRWQQMAVEICQHPRGPPPRPGVCVCS